MACSKQIKLIEDEKKYGKIPRIKLLYHICHYPWSEPNGYVNWIDKQLNDWMSQYMNFYDKYDQLKMSDLSYLISIIFRGSQSKERLLNATKLNAWIFWADTFIEFCEREDDAKTMINAGKKFNAGLINGYDREHPPQEQFLQMHGDTFQSMIDTGLTKYQQMRLIEDINKYYDINFHYVNEKFNKRNSMYESVDVFLDVRKRDALGGWTMTCAEYTWGIAINEKSFNGEEFQYIWQLACELHVILNDLISFAKEYTNDGAIHNYIRVYADINSTTFERSYENACKLLNDKMHMFEHSLKHIIESEIAAKDPNIYIFCKYIIRDTVYGAMQWSDMSGRYRSDKRWRNEIHNPDLSYEQQIALLGEFV